MKITKIVLINFKSFSGKHTIEIPTDGLLQLVGRNGSGKSCLLEAVLFLLKVDSTSSRERLKYTTFNKKSCVVEVTFSGFDNPKSGVELKLGRYLTSNKSCFYVNKRNVMKKTYKHVLEMYGFSTNFFASLSDDFITRFIDDKGPNRYDLFVNCLGLRFGQTRKAIVAIEALLSSLDEEIHSLTRRCASLEKRKEEGDSKKIRHSKLCIAAAKIVMSQRHIELCLKKIQELARTKTVCTRSLEVDKSQRLAENVFSVIEQEEKRIADARKKAVESHDSEEHPRLRENDGESCSSDQDSTDEAVMEIEILLDQKKKAKLVALNAVKMNEMKLLEAGIGPSAPSEQNLEVLSDKLKKINLIISVLTNARNDLNSLEEEYKNKLKTEPVLKQEREKEIALLKKLHSSLLNKQRECFEKIDDLTDKQKTIVKNYMQKRKEMSYRLGKNTVEGLQSVRTILQNWERSSNSAEQELAKTCKGFVIDNFKHARTTALGSVQVCFWVVAGLSLFKLIVENQLTVKRIINEMDRLKLPGKINFILLDKLRAFEVRYIPETTDYHMLLEEIECSSDMEPVIYRIFKDVVICRSAKVAIDVRKKHKIACVSFNGDLFKKEGIIGMPSKADKRRPIVRVYDKWVSLQKEEMEIKTVIAETLKSIEGMRSEMNRITMARQNVETEILKYNISSIEENLRQTVINREKKEEELEKFKHSRQIIEKQIEKTEHKEFENLFLPERVVQAINEELARLRTTIDSLALDIESLQSQLDAVRAKREVGRKIKQLGFPQKRFSCQAALQHRGKDKSIVPPPSREVDEPKEHESEEITVLRAEIKTHKDLIANLRNERINSFVLMNLKIFTDSELKKYVENKEGLIEERLRSRVNLPTRKEVDELKEETQLLKLIVASFNRWLSHYVQDSFLNIQSSFHDLTKLLSPAISFEMRFSKETNEIFLYSVPEDYDESPQFKTTKKLSPAEKLLVSTAFILVVRKAQDQNFCIIDEVDKALPSGQDAHYGRILADIDKMQLFFVSHSGGLVLLSGSYFSVDYTRTGSLLTRREIKR